MCERWCFNIKITDKVTDKLLLVTSGKSPFVMIALALKYMNRPNTKIEIRTPENLRLILNETEIPKDWEE